MKRKLLEILPYVVILVVVILIKTFVFTTVKVNGNSMYPTLHDADLMILNKIEYRFDDIKRFDVVVLKYDREYLIKRIIGLPGEDIEYKDNVLYVDGKKVKDVYNSIEQDDFLVSLGDDEYFVMGDNRGDSLDSRSFGPVDRNDISGHANFVFFPFSRWGKAK